MTAKGWWRSRKPAQLVELIRGVLELRRYLAGPVLRDPPHIRRARIRTVYANFLTDSDVPAEAFQPVIDHIVEKILSEVVTPAEGGATVREATAQIAATENDAAEDEPDGRTVGGV
jgi:hypothetical protein